MTDVEPELGEVHPARAHRRRRLLVALGVVAVMANVSIAGWYYTQPDPLKSWAPIATWPPPTVGCLEVKVAGCLPYEKVGTYPDNDPAVAAVPSRYPTMHVPIGGPFPTFTIQSTRSTTQPVSTRYEVWTQLVTPVDGSYDYSVGRFDLPKGFTSYTGTRSVGPEQQAVVRELYARGISVSVWQIVVEQVPLDPPSGFYAQSVLVGAENFAIVYGS